MSFFGFGSSAPVEEIPFIPVSSKPINEKAINADKVVENLSEELVGKLDAKLEEFKTYLTSPASQWEPFLEAKGVKGARRFEEGKDLAVIRSETVLPFHIVDIFEFINNTKNAPTLDSMVNHAKVLKRFSNHSWVGCVTLHGQWPVVSPREFVNLYNWRLLEDGSVLYLDFSAAFDELKPENEEAVRGWDSIIGYFLRPTEDGSGTDVHMVFDSSPKGDLPSVLINQAMLNQPTSLSIIRDELTKLQSAGKTRDVTLPARYEDFVGAVTKNAAL